MIRWAVVVLCLLGDAQAAPPTVRLMLEAPAGCPDRAWVAARVAQQLGRPGVTADSERIAVVQVSPAGAGWVAQLRLDGAARRLTTQQPDCRGLLDAVALALAVALDPIRALAGGPGPDPVAPAAAEAVQVQAAAPAPQPVAPTPAARPEVIRASRGAANGTLWARAGGALSVGETPGDWGLGAAVGVGWRGQALSAVAGLRWVAPSALGVRGGAVEADLWAVDAAGCVQALPPLGLCAVVAGGVQRAAGVDFARTQAVVAPWLAAGGRGELRLPLVDGLEGVVTGDLLLPISRLRLRVDGAVVWSRWPVAPGGRVGLAWRL